MNGCANGFPADFDEDYCEAMSKCSKIVDWQRLAAITALTYCLAGHGQSLHAHISSLRYSAGSTTDGWTAIIAYRDRACNEYECQFLHNYCRK